ncbi:unnamed protein product [Prunus brigantina]
MNKVVSMLRSELDQVKREKNVIELRGIRMEKLLDHCLDPKFEQEVSADLALLKNRTNRCVVSHLFNRCEEDDEIEGDEGQSKRNEGEEKEEDRFEGDKEQQQKSEGGKEEVQRKRIEGDADEVIWIDDNNGNTMVASSK